MNRKTWVSALLLLVLPILISGPASAQNWDGNRINYTYTDSSGNTVSNAEILAYDCGDSTCSTKNPFSGSLTYGSTTQNSEITADYPADLIEPSWEYSYALFHFSDGYLPKEFVSDRRCPEQPEDYELCGNEVDQKQFNKKDVCTAEPGSLSVENEIYAAEPVTVEVPAEMSSETKSAFENTNTGVNFLPPEKYRDQYYSTKTQIDLIITDSNGNEVYSSTKNANIFMKETESSQFNWEPSQSGSYTLKVQTQVTDPQCASTETRSTTQSITVQDERPRNEYYTILNSLELQRDSKVAGNEHTFSFTKISNYADYDEQRTDEYKKHPVKTELSYNIKKSGSTVDSGTRTLSKNNDPTTESSHTISWTPQTSGEYSVEITGESVPTDTYGLNRNTNPQTLADNQITVEPKPKWQVDFHVNGQSGDLKNAEISLDGSSKTTDVNGDLSFTGLTKGTYTYTISKTGYASESKELSIQSSTPDPKSVSSTLSYTNTAPTLNLPDSLQQVEQGTKNTKIDLDDYVNDDQSPDSDIQWSTSKSGLSGVDVSVVDSPGDPKNHELEIAAQESFTGQGTITATATDPAGESASDTVSVEVTQSNTAPTIDPIPDISLKEDQSRFDVYDIRNFVLDEQTSFTDLQTSFNTDAQGCGATLQDNSVQISPDNNYNGACTATLTASDPAGATASESFQVKVEPVNDPPKIISSPGSQPVSVKGEHSYTVGVEDPDSSDSISTLQFAVISGPTGLKINDNGAVSWTPSSSQEGQGYTAEVQVKDTQGATDTQSYEMQVQDTTNEPPSPSFTVSDQSGLAPFETNFDASDSTDPDGAVSSYNWAFGEGSTGSGPTTTHTFTKPGEYVVELQVTDNEGTTSTDTELVEVLGNKKPELTSTPILSVYAGEQYSYQAAATDPEQKSITYSLLKAPQGMSINSDTGQVSWDAPETPTNYQVEIQASDGKKTDKQSYSVEVKPKTSTGANIYFNGEPTKDSFKFSHNQTVNLNSTPGPNTSNIDIQTNYTGQSIPQSVSRTGDYNRELILDKSGNFSFSAAAGGSQPKFLKSTDKATVEVAKTPTQASVEFLDPESGQQVSQVETGETVRVLSSSGQQQHARPPISLNSTLPESSIESSWTNFTGEEGTGSYQQEVTFTEPGSYSFESAAGAKESDYEFTTQSRSLTVQEPQTQDSSEESSGGGGGGGGGGSSAFESTPSVSPVSSETGREPQTDTVQRRKTVEFEKPEQSKTVSGSVPVDFDKGSTVELSVGPGANVSLSKSAVNVSADGKVPISLEPQAGLPPGKHKTTVTMVSGESSEEVLVEFEVSERLGGSDLDVSVQDSYTEDETVSYFVGITTDVQDGAEADIQTSLDIAQETSSFISSTVLRNVTLARSLGDLEPGEYNLTVTLTYRGEEISDTGSFEVKPENPGQKSGNFITGSFSQAQQSVSQAIGMLNNAVSQISRLLGL